MNSRILLSDLLKTSQKNGTKDYVRERPLHLLQKKKILKLTAVTKFAKNIVICTPDFLSKSYNAFKTRI